MVTEPEVDMPYTPVSVGGRTRLISLPHGSNAEEAAQYVDEQTRIDGVVKARSYYEGVQYDEANKAKADECGVADPALLPEHERLHNYSTHISESVDFVADQLSSGFAVTASDPKVQEAMDAAYAASDVLTAEGEEAADEDEEGEDDDVIEDVMVSCDSVLREALIGSDVPYEVKWNPFDETCFFQFWESENVEFVTRSGSQKPIKVIRRESRWVDWEEGGDVERKEVEERVEYALHQNEVGEWECRKDTYWDDEEAPRESQWLGLPIIPWGLLRAGLDGLRGFRGRSFITLQVMDSVRRFDALEQYAFIVTRYNSHGNLVTVGDASALQIENNGGVRKDVADVVSFPEGTRAFALELPTQTDMLEHQRKVLEEAIYKKFGLTRVEPDTLQSLGQVSGYALEILNRKSTGTLGRITRQFKKDWKAMVNLMLDVHAYRQAVVVALNEDGTVDPIDIDDPEFELLEGTLPMQAFWDIDPQDVYPDRAVQIRMGTGYIVDDVAIRDDFTAKLISQQEALRKRGYSKEQIDRIMDEQKNASPTEGQISEAARQIADSGTEGDSAVKDESGAGRGTLASTARPEAV